MCLFSHGSTTMGSPPFSEAAGNVDTQPRVLHHLSLRKPGSHYGGLMIGSSYRLLLPFVAPYHGAPDHSPCPFYGQL